MCVRNSEPVSEETRLEERVHSYSPSISFLLGAGPRFPRIDCIRNAPLDYPIDKLRTSPKVDQGYTETVQKPAIAPRSPISEARPIVATRETPPPAAFPA